MILNLILVCRILNRSWLLHETFQLIHTYVNFLQYFVRWRLSLIFKSIVHKLFDFRYEALMLLDKLANQFGLTNLREISVILVLLPRDVSHVYKVAYFFIKEHIEDLNLQNMVVGLIILF